MINPTTFFAWRLGSLIRYCAHWQSVIKTLISCSVTPRLRILLAAALVLSAPLQPAAAEDATHIAQQLKSAFILNISRFIYWPEEVFQTGGDFQLCIFRDNPLGTSFEELQGRKIKGHPVNVQIVDELPEVGKCHTLFIPANHIDDIEEPIYIKHMLTINDLTEASRKSRYEGQTTISLMRKSKRIGIGIHQESARKVSLKLSSELLKLGKILDD